MSSQTTSHEKKPALAEAIAETRWRISDMDQRVLLHQKRIERILTSGLGPADAMQAMLADMVQARDRLQAQVDSFIDDYIGVEGSEASQTASGQ